MRFIKNKRKFLVNKKTNLKVTDVGKIILRKNEHLTIEVSKKKNEICGMNWGLYITSSINQRLKNEGFETVLVKNSYKKLYVMLVLKSKIKSFKKYISKEKIKIIKNLG